MLDAEEVDESMAVGAARYDYARASGLVNARDCHKNPAEARRDDQYGALAECMVAERLERAWPARAFVGRRDNGEDVAGGIDVKWTRHLDGHLMVRADARRDLLYVLVVGPAWPLAIAGWATFEFATQERFWQVDGLQFPSFYVPRGVLEAIELLEGSYAKADRAAARQREAL